jgi:hypothetical protein
MYAYCIYAYKGTKNVFLAVFRGNLTQLVYYFISSYYMYKLILNANNQVSGKL